MKKSAEINRRLCVKALESVRDYPLDITNDLLPFAEGSAIVSQVAVVIHYFDMNPVGNLHNAARIDVFVNDRETTHDIDWITRQIDVVLPFPCAPFFP